MKISYKYIDLSKEFDFIRKCMNNRLPSERVNEQIVFVRKQQT